MINKVYYYSDLETLIGSLKQYVSNSEDNYEIEINSTVIENKKKRGKKQKITGIGWELDLLKDDKIKKVIKFIIKSSCLSSIKSVNFSDNFLKYIEKPKLLLNKDNSKKIADDMDSLRFLADICKLEITED